MDSSVLITHEWSFGNDNVLADKLKQLVLSLEAWREDHRQIFHQWSDVFTDESLVICEEFKLVEILN